MAEGKKGRPCVLAKLKDDLSPFDMADPDGPWSLKRWAGLWIVVRHGGWGIGERVHDMGWSVAAPVGHGGLADQWFDGWLPLPGTTPPPPSLRKAQRSTVGRVGDMDPSLALMLHQQGDSDWIVAIGRAPRGGLAYLEGDGKEAQVEFCSAVGGGRSPRVREALRALAVAIEEDNREAPQPGLKLPASDHG